MDRAMDEQQLLSQVKAGNQEAFAEIIRRYQDKVFLTVMGFVHQKEDAEDVTQEIFVKVYRSLDTFRGDASFFTWLYRLSVNMAMNHVRDNKKRKSTRGLGDMVPAGEKKTLDFPDTSQVSPEKRLEDQQRARNLEVALNTLSESQRKAFLLSKYNDLSNPEIARVMKKSIPSVESLLFRAKVNLQKKLLEWYKKMDGDAQE